MSASPFCSTRHPARAGARLKSAPGFTLVELLTTLAIVGIASAVGIPMLSQFADDAAVSTQTDVLMQSLNYVRSEAVKRNARVTMCRSTDASTCAATAVDAEWRGGWIVFVDDGVAAVRESTDTILRVQGTLSGKGKLIGSGNVSDYVSYTSNGQLRLADGSAQTGTFSSCSSNGKGKRRKVSLTAGTGWIGTDIVAANVSCTAA